MDGLGSGLVWNGIDGYLYMEIGNGVICAKDYGEGEVMGGTFVCELFCDFC